MESPDLSPVVSVFDRASSTYDAVGVDFFSKFGERLVDHADIGTTDVVLDVGCGAGAVLLPAAFAASDGSVTGIDLSPGMIERCRAAIARSGLTNAEARLGDAAAPPVDAGSVSVLTCGLVIFFLPDPAAALDAYRTALRPGGTLALSTFGEEDPRFMAVFGAIAAHIPVAPDETDGTDGTRPRRAQKGPFTSTEAITELLAAHGFVEIDHALEMNEVVFTNPQQWIDWSWSHGARVLWESVPEADRGAAETDAIAALGELAEPDGSIVHRWPVRYTTALTRS